MAFGHHRVEAARRERLASVSIDVRPLSDCHMVQMLASENATQRGTTAAASLDAIAAMCRLVIDVCSKCDNPEEVPIIIGTSIPAARSIWGKIRQGGVPGEECIQAIAPDGAFSLTQIRLALNVLRDSGRLPGGDGIVFDARCAKLFKLDYHLQEYRRIVTSEGVQSYLPVEGQFAFAQQIIAEFGSGEVTAIKLRERANVLFYEQLGMPRSQMRRSRLRASDDRVRDALNLMRRGTSDIKRSCKMLADLIAEGAEAEAEVIDRFKQYVAEIDAALKSLAPTRGKRGNLRLITNNRESVA